MKSCCVLQQATTTFTRDNSAIPNNCISAVNPGHGTKFLVSLQTIKYLVDYVTYKLGVIKLFISRNLGC